MEAQGRAVHPLPQFGCLDPTHAFRCPALTLIPFDYRQFDAVKL
jgi:hypothetical protein